MSSSFFFFYEDPDLNTPLHVALQKGNWVIISLLMEHIQPNIKFNIRNKNNKFPYQCTNNPAIRDLFYRTYVVNSSSPEKEALGIDKLSHKLQYSCNQYRKAMLEKYIQAQERCEKDKKQIINSFQNQTPDGNYPYCICRFCECKGCQGCQYKGCQKIAKYFEEANIKENPCGYCENCIQYNNNNKIIKIEQIPSSYPYPDFKNFISNKSQDKKT